MDRRIPYYLKGKEKENEFSPPPPRKRIRAPVLDNADLISENSLTLMGRLTNPSSQRLWSLIPFLSNRWNLRGKAIGSDLGRGCFQFRFEYEEDLQKVLDNRPYHFDQWMVILQRWEPVISATFPSQIPFWIELQGLPMHFWKPSMLLSIGSELGDVVDHEITPSAAKIKVTIDGLKPITKETIVDFEDGSEILVTLEYKSLKNHCLHCLRLSHEKKDCPGLQLTKHSPPKSLPIPSKTVNKAKSQPSYTPRDYTRRTVENKSHYSTSNKVGERSSSRRSYGANEFRTQHPHESRRFEPRGLPYRRSPPRSYASSREEAHILPARHSHSNSRHNLQWGEKSTSRDSHRREYSDSSRTRFSNLEKSAATEVTPPPPPPIPTTEEVMGELREVTLQYTSCADPTESAARKRRVVQGEARVLMAETAAQMIEAATKANQVYLRVPADQHHPIPESQSDLPTHPAELPEAPNAPAKKKRGRPPLNRSQNRSPLTLNGVKSSKRNKCLIQNSPKRRSVTEKTGPPGEEKLLQNKKAPTKKKLMLQGDANNPSASNAAPKGTIIPAMVKPKMDFHNPSNLLP